MTVVKVYDLNGDSRESIELNDKIFNADINKKVLYEVINAYKTNQHQGTKATKNRALVSGSNTKPFRQKGTGRARAGTRKSPVWRHGGHTFNLTPFQRRIKVSKTKRNIALMSALSSKFKNKDIMVVIDFNLDAPKTKKIVRMLDKLKCEKGALLVLPEKNENVYRSIKNIKKSSSTIAGHLNSYEVLKYDKLIFFKTALTKLEAVFK